MSRGIPKNQFLLEVYTRALELYPVDIFQCCIFWEDPDPPSLTRVFLIWRKPSSVETNNARDILTTLSGFVAPQVQIMNFIRFSRNFLLQTTNGWSSLLLWEIRKMFPLNQTSGYRLTYVQLLVLLIRYTRSHLTRMLPTLLHIWLCLLQWFARRRFAVAR